MHRHHPLGRQDVIQDGEDRLLHLARIGGAADQDQFLGEIDRDHGLAGRTMFGGVGIEAWQVDDGEFRIEISEVFDGGPDQELVHEQRMPGIFGDDANLDAVGKIGAAEQILGEQFLAFGEGHHVGIQRVEMGWAHRLVVVPPDIGFAVGVLDHEFVGCRAASVMPGQDDQRPILGDVALTPPDRFLVEGGRRQIPIHRFEIAEAMMLPGHSQTFFLTASFFGGPRHSGRPQLPPGQT